jgi:hypothetical protein
MSMLDLYNATTVHLLDCAMTRRMADRGDKHLNNGILLKPSFYHIPGGIRRCVLSDEQGVPVAPLSMSHRRPTPDESVDLGL